MYFFGPPDVWTAFFLRPESWQADVRMTPCMAAGTANAI
jgi:hypothetical protein